MDFKPWKTLKREVIQENPWSSFYHDIFETADGKRGDYYYMRTPVGSVLVVPLLADGRLVLHREYRYLFDRVSLEFPSGGIKLDQTPTQAALAELEEETGYQAKSIKKIQEVAPANGMFLEYTHVFFAQDLTKTQMNPDEFERFEIVLMTPEEVDRAIKEGEIWDGFSLSGWLLVRNLVLQQRLKI
jgi:ADP-ribose pyrophosphatase